MERERDRGGGGGEEKERERVSVCTLYMYMYIRMYMYSVCSHVEHTMYLHLLPLLHFQLHTGPVACPEAYWPLPVAS